LKPQTQTYRIWSTPIYSSKVMLIDTLLSQHNHTHPQPQSKNHPPIPKPTSQPSQRSLVQHTYAARFSPSQFHMHAHTCFDTSASFWPVNYEWPCPKSKANICTLACLDPGTHIHANVPPHQRPAPPPPLYTCDHIPRPNAYPVNTVLTIGSDNDSFPLFCCVLFWFWTRSEKYALAIDQSSAGEIYVSKLALNQDGVGCVRVCMYACLGVYGFACMRVCIFACMRV